MSYAYTRWDRYLTHANSLTNNSNRMHWFCLKWFQWFWKRPNKEEKIEQRETLTHCERQKQDLAWKLCQSDVKKIFRLKFIRIAVANCANSLMHQFCNINLGFYIVVLCAWEFFFLKFGIFELVTRLRSKNNRKQHPAEGKKPLTKNEVKDWLIGLNNADENRNDFIQKVWRWK